MVNCIYAEEKQGMLNSEYTAVNYDLILNGSKVGWNNCVRLIKGYSDMEFETTDK